MKPSNPNRRAWIGWRLHLAPLLPFLALLAPDAKAQEDPLILEAPEGAVRQSVRARGNQAGPGLVVAGGEVVFRELDPNDRDDSIPLPNPPVRQAGELGDVRVAEASGDPYFLGFAAGDYRPPASETVDPLLLEILQRLPADRPGATTYAYVMFQKRITPERVARLEGLGVRVLGKHPFYALEVALPAGAVQSVAGLDFVRWIGAPRPFQKVHPLLAERAGAAGPDELLDVYVTVHESDLGPAATFEHVGTASEVTPENAVAGALPESLRAKRWRSNGPAQKALEALGLEVRDYSDSIHAFRARLRVADLAAVRDLDFVEFVELDLPKETTHDESMPFMNVDRVRGTDNGGTYKAAVLGEVDSGIETPHYALNHIYGWGWDLAGTAGGAWDDQNGHGSHVAGTILGLPPAGKEELTGVAPALGSEAYLRVFNVKVFNDAGSWGGASLQDIFDRMHSSVTYNGSTTPRPHVVSNSWRSTWSGTPFIGSEADARLLDNEVYFQGQLYVFAAGNEGPSSGSLGLQPAAKNAFTVGNVIPYESSAGNPGTISSSSSRGPCGDGRWKPNVCAPGTGIESVNSHTVDGYTVKSGTSMATPHVSGVAATLVDRYSFLRYRPAVLGSLLMATAMTKGNQTISTPSDSHLDTYGTGRVDAYRALRYDSQQATYFWGFNQGSSGWAELPFTVQSGATRLTVVMHYKEVACGAGSSKALVNDLDMWLDAAPFASGGASGDYYAHQSSLDNTEIRIIDNPTVGDWKAKVFPEDVSGYTPQVGVSVIIAYGDLTPDGSYTLAANKTFAKPNEVIEVTGSVYNPTYIADGVYLDSSSSSGMTLVSSTQVLLDGAVADLMNNPSGGKDVLLGDITHGSTRAVKWGVRWASEGVKSFSANLESDNMVLESKSVSITIDGTAPGTPGNVHSTTHTKNGHSCNTSVSMSWNAASDTLSGVKGYALSWTQSASSDPGTTIDTSGLTWTQGLGASSSPWYFHVRAIDNALNAGSIVHVGPFYVNTASASTYCSGNPNSTGNVAQLVASGPICLGTKQLTMYAYDMPKNQYGHFMMSQNQAFVPFFGGSQGNLCLGAPLYRFSQHILNTGNSGSVTFPLPFDNLPGGVQFQHGQVWNFQFWVRDVGQKSNTTNGLEVQFD